MTDAREYLTSIRKAEERPSLKKRQVENLRDRLTSLSVPTDKEVVSHTPNVGVMADTVAMIADMDAEISRQSAENVLMEGQAYLLLNKLPPEYSSLLIDHYIRLNSLEQPLLEKVDNGELAFTPAVELSYLNPEEQGWVRSALETTQQTPSLSQAQRIKQESKEGKLTEESVLSIMAEEKKPLYNSVTLSHDTLKKYFPRSYTAKQMEKVIIKLLDNWLKKRQQEQQR